MSARRNTQNSHRAAHTHIVFLNQNNLIKDSTLTFNRKRRTRRKIIHRVVFLSSSIVSRGALTKVERIEAAAAVAAAKKSV